MSRLTRKLGRDLFRMKGQVFTIALVLGCGVMAMIMMRSTYESLVRSRDTYYREYRFGDVFARLERAPEAVRGRLERIPGVARVYTRVVEEVMVPIETMPEPVSGRIVSIPDDGVPPLNGLHLKSGRLPDPAVTDEAVLLEQFARARHQAFVALARMLNLFGEQRQVSVAKTVVVRYGVGQSGMRQRLRNEVRIGAAAE